jgi:hypothetical protein
LIYAGTSKWLLWLELGSGSNKSPIKHIIASEKCKIKNKNKRTDVNKKDLCICYCTLVLKAYKTNDTWCQQLSWNRPWEFSSYSCGNQILDLIYNASVNTKNKITLFP